MQADIRMLQVNSTSTREFIISSCLNGFIVVLVSVCIGLLILNTPLFALVIFGMVGIISGLAFFAIPAYICVGAAVLAATLSRLAVVSGFVPPAANFVHFPLALGAAIVAGNRGAAKELLPLASSIAKGLWAILFVSIYSWIANGGEFSRPLLTWLVFCEPFLIVYALLKAPPDARAERWLWKAVFGIAFLQLPLGLWQAFTLGWADAVQGTLVGMAAGAHVAAGITTIGVVLCVSKGLAEKSLLHRCAWIVSALALFIFPILSDAKQVLIAFLPALIFMTTMSGTFPLKRLIPIAVLLGLAIYAAFYFYLPLRMAMNWDLVSHGLQGKIEAMSVIGTKMSNSFHGWFVGLGPGNSVSRVALLSVGGVVEKSSPVYLLGLQLAPTTRDILYLWSSNQLFSSSSVWSGISSWFGLIGDLGIVGLGIYLWIVLKLWKELSRGREWAVHAAKVSLIMAGILGFMFSWLEEPSFTLFLALTVGLALISKASNIRQ